MEYFIPLESEFGFLEYDLELYKLIEVFRSIPLAMTQSQCFRKQKSRDPPWICRGELAEGHFHFYLTYIVLVTITLRFRKMKSVLNGVHPYRYTLFLLFIVICLKIIHKWMHVTTDSFHGTLLFYVHSFFYLHNWKSALSITVSVYSREVPVYVQREYRFWQFSKEGTDTWI